jgi:hypothetical protein
VQVAGGGDAAGGAMGGVAASDGLKLLLPQSISLSV